MTGWQRRLLTLVAIVTVAWAAAPQDATAVSGDGSERALRPRLMLQAVGADDLAEAPLLDTEVLVTVRGPLARTRVRQVFSNPSPCWVEGTYVFPLPPGAAVDRLHMVVGDRTIEGRIMERGEARRTYEQARTEGRRSSLVEQERPNIFSTSVANIGPDDRIEILMEYQETLRFDDGGFSLRFPMVVGPRYEPAARVRTISGQTAAAGADPIPDSSSIASPVVAASALNPVRLTVDLDPGLPPASIASPSHPIHIEPAGEHRSTVTLEQGPVPADRDFVLEWSPAVGDTPRATLLVEDFEAEAYALLMVVPPAAEAAETAILPRETVFVIDTSGSMHGASIQQGRAALLWAIDRLRPDDEFNIIQFNSVTSKLFEGSRQAFPATLDAAREYVAGLTADGGTEMLPALDAALRDPGTSAAVRQVIFITDGCVGNEAELLGFIQARLGRSRLFTVGIGSAPNAHFMEQAASFGRGTFTYIGHTAEVGEKMRALLSKIDAPIVSEIEVTWPDAAAESFPQRIPDLYRGEPLVVAARMATLGGEVLVTGRRGLEPWQVRLPVAVGEPRGGVHQLWAGRKIADLVNRSPGRTVPDETRSEIVLLGLRHHLVSRFTSLVAVEVSPTRPADLPLARHRLPVNLPHGWSLPSVLGQLPQGATPAPSLVAMGCLLLLAGLAAGRISR